MAHGCSGEHGRGLLRAHRVLLCALVHIFRKKSVGRLSAAALLQLLNERQNKQKKNQSALLLESLINVEDM